MDEKEFSEWLYNTTVMAGMDQYYYQIMAWAWGSVDFLVKFATAIFATASVIAAAFEMNEKLPRESRVPMPDWAVHPDKGRWPRFVACMKDTFFVCPVRFCAIIFAINQKWSWSMRLAAWSAVFAALVIASPIATRPAKYDSLYEQWTTLRADMETFTFDFETAKREKKLDGVEAACLGQKRQEITRRVADIERQEPFPWMSLVEYCLRAEERRQDVDGEIRKSDQKGATPKGAATKQVALGPPEAF
jgi:hypothetical protein